MDGILIVGWLACAIFAAVIASSKGRSGGAWFLLGCLFGIFTLLAVGFMPAEKKKMPQPAQRLDKSYA